MIVREEESQDSMPPQDKYSVQSSSTSQRLTSFCLDGGLEDQKQLQFNFHPAGCAVDTFSYCDSQKFQNFAGLQLIDKHHGTTCIRDLSRPISAGVSSRKRICGFGGSESLPHLTKLRRQDRTISTKWLLLWHWAPALPSQPFW